MHGHTDEQREHTHTVWVLYCILCVGHNLITHCPHVLDTVYTVKESASKLAFNLYRG